jgi:hypothetical protein
MQLKSTTDQYKIKNQILKIKILDKNALSHQRFCYNLINEYGGT